MKRERESSYKPTCNLATGEEEIFFLKSPGFLCNFYIDLPKSSTMLRSLFSVTFIILMRCSNLRISLLFLQKSFFLFTYQMLVICCLYILLFIFLVILILPSNKFRLQILQGVTVPYIFNIQRLIPSFFLHYNVFRLFSNNSQPTTFKFFY